MAEKQELAKANNNYLDAQNENLAELIAEELGGDGVGIESIKADHKSIKFILNDENGEPIGIEEFSGVILHNHDTNAYFPQPFNGSHEPPACYSHDGLTGVGDPGGECRTCPHNQFDQATGRKKCTNRKKLYILREGEYFPMLLSLSPANLNAFKDYKRNIVQRKHKKVCNVVTNFTIAEGKNAKGMTFPQVTAKVDRDLTPEEITALAPYVEQMKQIAGAAPITFAEVDDGLFEPEA